MKHCSEKLQVLIAIECFPDNEHNTRNTQTCKTCKRDQASSQSVRQGGQGQQQLRLNCQNSMDGNYVLRRITKTLLRCRKEYEYGLEL